MAKIKVFIYFFTSIKFFFRACFLLRMRKVLEIYYCRKKESSFNFTYSQMISKNLYLCDDLTFLNKDLKKKIEKDINHQIIIKIALLILSNQQSLSYFICKKFF